MCPGRRHCKQHNQTNAQLDNHLITPDRKGRCCTPDREGRSRPWRPALDELHTTHPGITNKRTIKPQTPHFHEETQNTNAEASIKVLRAKPSISVTCGGGWVGGVVDWSVGFVCWLVCLLVGWWHVWLVVACNCAHILRHVQRTWKQDKNCMRM